MTHVLAVADKRPRSVWAIIEFPLASKVVPGKLTVILKHLYAFNRLKSPFDSSVAFSGFQWQGIAAQLSFPVFEYLFIKVAFSNGFACIIQGVYAVEVSFELRSGMSS